MKKLILKSCLYLVLVFLVLEVLVRVFHLHRNTPGRYIDDYNVEKWIPNQEGYNVTGNRRQNFSKFRINNLGFNSYRDYAPTKNKFEIALVGDSFIEGFHQNYYNSIGKKIEDEIGNNLEIYEFGYGGYDFANQLHLINAYKDRFDLIDHVFLGIKFSNDFDRDRYEVQWSRINNHQSTFHKIILKSKLITYLRNIGVLSIPMDLIRKLRKQNAGLTDAEETPELNLERIENFKKIAELYNFDKNRFTLFLESKITPQVFLDFLETNEYRYIDVSPFLEASKKLTTLVYDKHWNNTGRTIVANEIIKYIKSNNIKVNK